MMFNLVRNTLFSLHDGSENEAKCSCEIMSYKLFLWTIVGLDPLTGYQVGEEFENDTQTVSCDELRKDFNKSTANLVKEKEALYSPKENAVKGIGDEKIAWEQAKNTFIEEIKALNDAREESNLKIRGLDQQIQDLSRRGEENLDTLRYEMKLILSTEIGKLEQNLREMTNLRAEMENQRLVEELQEMKRMAKERGRQVSDAGREIAKLKDENIEKREVIERLESEIREKEFQIYLLENEMEFQVDVQIRRLLEEKLQAEELDKGKGEIDVKGEKETERVGKDDRESRSVLQDLNVERKEKEKAVKGIKEKKVKKRKTIKNRIQDNESRMEENKGKENKRQSKREGQGKLEERKERQKREQSLEEEKIRNEMSEIKKKHEPGVKRHVNEKKADKGNRKRKAKRKKKRINQKKQEKAKRRMNTKMRQRLQIAALIAGIPLAYIDIIDLLMFYVDLSILFSMDWEDFAIWEKCAHRIGDCIKKKIDEMLEKNDVKKDAKVEITGEGKHRREENTKRRGIYQKREDDKRTEKGLHRKSSSAKSPGGEIVRTGDDKEREMRSLSGQQNGKTNQCVARKTDDKEQTTATDDKEPTTATDDKEPTTATDDKEQTTATDDKEQTTATDDKEQTTATDDKEPTTATDDKEQTTATDDREQTAATDDKEPTTVTDDKEQTAATDDKEQTSATDDKEPTTANDDKEQSTATDDKEQSTATDDKEQTTATDDKEQTTANDDKEQTTETDDKEQTTATDDKEQTAAADDKEQTKATENSVSKSKWCCKQGLLKFLQGLFRFLLASCNILMGFFVIPYKLNLTLFQAALIKAFLEMVFFGCVFGCVCLVCGVIEGIGWVKEKYFAELENTREGVIEMENAVKSLIKNEREIELKRRILEKKEKERRMKENKGKENKRQSKREGRGKLEERKERQKREREREQSLEEEEIRNEMSEIKKKHEPGVKRHVNEKKADKGNRKRKAKRKKKRINQKKQEKAKRRMNTKMRQRLQIAALIAGIPLAYIDIIDLLMFYVDLSILFSMDWEDFAIWEKCAHRIGDCIKKKIDEMLEKNDVKKDAKVEITGEGKQRREENTKRRRIYQKREDDKRTEKGLHRKSSSTKSPGGEIVRTGDDKEREMRSLSGQQNGKTNQCVARNTDDKEQTTATDDKEPTTATDDKEQTTATDDKEQTTATDDKEPTTATDDKEQTTATDDKEPTTATDDKEQTTATDDREQTAATDDKEPATVTDDKEQTAATDDKEQTSATDDKEPTTANDDKEQTTATDDKEQSTATDDKEQTTATDDKEQTTANDDKEQTTATDDKEQTTATDDKEQTAAADDKEQTKATENSVSKSKWCCKQGLLKFLQGLFRFLLASCNILMGFFVIPYKLNLTLFQAALIKAFLEMVFFGCVFGCVCLVCGVIEGIGWVKEKYFAELEITREGVIEMENAVKSLIKNEREIELKRRILEKKDKERRMKENKGKENKRQSKREGRGKLEERKERQKREREREQSLEEEKIRNEMSEIKKKHEPGVKRHVNEKKADKGNRKRKAKRKKKRINQKKQEKAKRRMNTKMRQRLQIAALIAGIPLAYIDIIDLLMFYVDLSILFSMDWEDFAIWEKCAHRIGDCIKKKIDEMLEKNDVKKDAKVEITGEGKQRREENTRRRGIYQKREDDKTTEKVLHRKSSSAKSPGGEIVRTGDDKEREMRSLSGQQNGKTNQCVARNTDDKEQTTATDDKEQTTVTDDKEPTTATENSVSKSKWCCKQGLLKFLQGLFRFLLASCNILMGFFVIPYKLNLTLFQAALIKAFLEMVFFGCVFGCVCLVCGVIEGIGWVKEKYFAELEITREGVIEMENAVKSLIKNEREIELKRRILEKKEKERRMKENKGKENKRQSKREGRGKLEERKERQKREREREQSLEEEKIRNEMSEIKKKHEPGVKRHVNEKKADKGNRKRKAKRKKKRINQKKQEKAKRRMNTKMRQRLQIAALIAGIPLAYIDIIDLLMFYVDLSILFSMDWEDFAIWEKCAHRIGDCIKKKIDEMLEKNDVKKDAKVEITGEGKHRREENTKRRGIYQKREDDKRTEKGLHRKSSSAKSPGGEIVRTGDDKEREMRSLSGQQNGKTNQCVARKTDDKEQTTATDDKEQTTATDDKEPTTATDDKEQTTATDDKEQTTATDDKEQTTATDDKEPTTGTDDKEQTTATDDKEPTTATDDKEQTTATDDREQTAATDDKEPTTVTDDKEQTAATDDKEQTTATDDKEQTTATDDKEQTAATDDKEQTTATDDKEQTSATDDKEPTTANDDKEQTTATDDKEQSTATDDKEQTTATDDKEQTTANDDKEQTTATDDKEQTTATDDKEQTAAADDKEQTKATENSVSKSKWCCKQGLLKFLQGLFRFLLASCNILMGFFVIPYKLNLTLFQAALIKAFLEMVFFGCVFGCVCLVCGVIEGIGWVKEKYFAELEITREGVIEMENAVKSLIKNEREIELKRRILEKKEKERRMKENKGKENKRQSKREGRGKLEERKERQKREREREQSLEEGKIRNEMSEIKKKHEPGVKRHVNEKKADKGNRKRKAKRKKKRINQKKQEKAKRRMNTKMRQRLQIAALIAGIPLAYIDIIDLLMFYVDLSILFSMDWEDFAIWEKCAHRIGDCIKKKIDEMLEKNDVKKDAKVEITGEGKQRREENTKRRRIYQKREDDKRTEKGLHRKSSSAKSPGGEIVRTGDDKEREMRSLSGQQNGKTNQCVARNTDDKEQTTATDDKEQTTVTDDKEPTTATENSVSKSKWCCKQGLLKFLQGLFKFLLASCNILMGFFVVPYKLNLTLFQAALIKAFLEMVFFGCVFGCVCLVCGVIEGIGWVKEKYFAELEITREGVIEMENAVKSLIKNEREIELKRRILEKKDKERRMKENKGKENKRQSKREGRGKLEERKERQKREREREQSLEEEKIRNEMSEIKKKHEPGVKRHVNEKKADKGNRKRKAKRKKKRINQKKQEKAKRRMNTKMRQRLQIAALIAGIPLAYIDIIDLLMFYVDLSILFSMDWEDFAIWEKCAHRIGDCIKKKIDEMLEKNDVKKDAKVEITGEGKQRREENTKRRRIYQKREDDKRTEKGLHRKSSSAKSPGGEIVRTGDDKEREMRSLSGQQNGKTNQCVARKTDDKEQTTATDDKEQTTATDDKEPTTATDDKEQTTATDDKEQTTATDDKEQTTATDDKEPTTATDDKEQTTATDDKEPTTATDDKEQTTATDDREQTAATDDKEPTTVTDDKEQTAATDDKEQTTATDDKEQTTATDDKEQTAATDDKEQTTATDDKEQTSATDDKEPTTANDDKEQTTATDDKEQSTATDDKEQTTATDDKEQTTANDDKEQTTATDDKEQTTATDDKEQTAAADDKEQTKATENSVSKSKWCCKQGLLKFLQGLFRFLLASCNILMGFFVIPYKLNLTLFQAALIKAFLEMVFFGCVFGCVCLVCGVIEGIGWVKEKYFAELEITREGVIEMENAVKSLIKNEREIELKRRILEKKEKERRIKENKGKENKRQSKREGRGKLEERKERQKREREREQSLEEGKIRNEMSEIKKKHEPGVKRHVNEKKADKGNRKRKAKRKKKRINQKKQEKAKRRMNTKMRQRLQIAALIAGIPLAYIDIIDLLMFYVDLSILFSMDWEDFAIWEKCAHRIGDCIKKKIDEILEKNNVKKDAKVEITGEGKQRREENTKRRRIYQKREDDKRTEKGLHRKSSSAKSPGGEIVRTGDDKEREMRSLSGQQNGKTNQCVARNTDDKEQTTATDDKEPTTATDDKEQTTATDDKEQTTATDDKEPTTATDDKEQTTATDDKEPTTATDDKEQTTATDDREQTAATDDKEPTTVTDDKEQTAATDDKEQTSATDDKEPTTANDDKEQTTATDDKEQSTATDDKEQTTATDDKEQTTANDDKEQTTETDDKEQTTATDDKEQTAAADDKEQTKATENSVSKSKWCCKQGLLKFLQGLFRFLLASCNILMGFFVIPYKLNLTLFQAALIKAFLEMVFFGCVFGCVCLVCGVIEGIGWVKEKNFAELEITREGVIEMENAVKSLIKNEREIELKRRILEKKDKERRMKENKGKENKRQSKREGRGKLEERKERQKREREREQSLEEEKIRNEMSKIKKKHEPGVKRHVNEKKADKGNRKRKAKRKKKRINQKKQEKAKRRMNTKMRQRLQIAALIAGIPLAYIDIIDLLMFYVDLSILFSMDWEDFAIWEKCAHRIGDCIKKKIDEMLEKNDVKKDAKVEITGEGKQRREENTKRRGIYQKREDDKRTEKGLHRKSSSAKSPGGEIVRTGDDKEREMRSLSGQQNGKTNQCVARNTDDKEQTTATDDKEQTTVTDDKEPTTATENSVSKSKWCCKQGLLKFLQGLFKFLLASCNILMGFFVVPYKLNLTLFQAALIKAFLEMVFFGCVFGCVCLVCGVIEGIGWVKEKYFAELEITREGVIEMENAVKSLIKNEREIELKRRILEKKDKERRMKENKGKENKRQSKREGRGKLEERKERQKREREREQSLEEEKIRNEMSEIKKKHEPGVKRHVNEKKADKGNRKRKAKRKKKRINQKKQEKAKRRMNTKMRQRLQIAALIAGIPLAYIDIIDLLMFYVDLSILFSMDWEDFAIWEKCAHRIGDCIKKKIDEMLEKNDVKKDAKVEITGEGKQRREENTRRRGIYQKREDDKTTEKVLHRKSSSAKSPGGEIVRTGDDKEREMRSLSGQQNGKTNQCVARNTDDKEQTTATDDKEQTTVTDDKEPTTATENSVSKSKWCCKQGLLKFLQGLFRFLLASCNILMGFFVIPYKLNLTLFQAALIKAFLEMVFFGCVFGCVCLVCGVIEGIGWVKEKYFVELEITREGVIEMENAVKSLIKNEREIELKRRILEKKEKERRMKENKGKENKRQSKREGRGKLEERKERQKREREREQSLEEEKIRNEMSEIKKKHEPGVKRHVNEKKADKGNRKRKAKRKKKRINQKKQEKAKRRMNTKMRQRLQIAALIAGIPLAYIDIIDLLMFYVDLSILFSMDWEDFAIWEKCAHRIGDCIKKKIDEMLEKNDVKKDAKVEITGEGKQRREENTKRRRIYQKREDDKRTEKGLHRKSSSAKSPGGEIVRTGDDKEREMRSLSGQQDGNTNECVARKTDDKEQTTATDDKEPTTATENSVSKSKWCCKQGLLKFLQGLFKFLLASCNILMGFFVVPYKLNLTLFQAALIKAFLEMVFFGCVFGCVCLVCGVIEGIGWVKEKYFAELEITREGVIEMENAVKSLIKNEREIELKRRILEKKEKERRMKGNGKENKRQSKREGREKLEERKKTQEEREKSLGHLRKEPLQEAQRRLENLIKDVEKVKLQHKEIGVRIDDLIHRLGPSKVRK